MPTTNQHVEMIDLTCSNDEVPEEEKGKNKINLAINVDKLKDGESVDIKIEWSEEEDDNNLAKIHRNTSDEKQGEGDEKGDEKDTDLIITKL